MHGNVSEWVWDAYAAYDPAQTENPVGAETGSQRVYRGGAWNDFAKNLRSAYRAAMQPDLAAFNVGLRLSRNADVLQGTVDVYKRQTHAVTTAGGHGGGAGRQAV